MTELKRGQIAVDKKHFIDLINIIQWHINNIDSIMKEPSNLERGKKIAKQMNTLQFQLDAIKHFDLGIDLKKLNNKLLKPNFLSKPKIINP